MKKYFKGLFKSAKNYTTGFLNTLINGFFGLIKTIAILIIIIIIILVFQSGIMIFK